MLSKLARLNQSTFRVYARRALSTAESGGHHANPEFWRKVFLYVSVPALILSGINTFLMEMEHYNHYHRPEFVPYEYLRLRTKRFPWGDGNHSLFHNPRTNPLPEGWEDELD
ncbi:Cytochrome c oxidase subunit 6A1 [Sarcoptes scabiei]|uniref:Cytochrome c oxidase subunit n=1 Tax=Sarcoptes scabiei TaxID=52283 RepID=A0A834R9R9_SARSC|nr:Cytochrome c oxidase subunit 6A1 [Sarcoptes scabiei]